MMAIRVQNDVSRGGSEGGFRKRELKGHPTPRHFEHQLALVRQRYRCQGRPRRHGENRACTVGPDRHRPDRVGRAVDVKIVVRQRAAGIKAGDVPRLRTHQNQCPSSGSWTTPRSSALRASGTSGGAVQAASASSADSAKRTRRPEFRSRPRREPSPGVPARPGPDGESGGAFGCPRLPAGGGAGRDMARGQGSACSRAGPVPATPAVENPVFFGAIFNPSSRSATLRPPDRVVPPPCDPGNPPRRLPESGNPRRFIGAAILAASWGRIYRINFTPQ